MDITVYEYLFTYELPNRINGIQLWLTEAFATVSFWLTCYVVNIFRFFLVDGFYTVISSGSLSHLTVLTGTSAYATVFLVLCGYAIAIAGIGYIVNFEFVKPAQALMWGFVAGALFLSSASPGFNFIETFEQMRLDLGFVFATAVGPAATPEEVAALPLTDQWLINDYQSEVVGQTELELPTAFKQAYFEDPTPGNGLTQINSISVLSSPIPIINSRLTLYTDDPTTSADDKHVELRSHIDSRVILARAGSARAMESFLYTLLFAIVATAFGLLFVGAMICVYAFIAMLPLGFFEFGKLMLQRVISQYAAIFAATILTGVVLGVSLAMRDTMVINGMGTPFVAGLITLVFMFIMVRHAWSAMGGAIATMSTVIGDVIGSSTGGRMEGALSAVGNALNPVSRTMGAVGQGHYSGVARPGLIQQGATLAGVGALGVVSAFAAAGGAWRDDEDESDDPTASNGVGGGSASQSSTAFPSEAPEIPTSLGATNHWTPARTSTLEATSTNDAYRTLFTSLGAGGGYAAATDRFTDHDAVDRVSHDLAGWESSDEKAAVVAHALAADSPSTFRKAVEEDEALGDRSSSISDWSAFYGNVGMMHASRESVATHPGRPSSPASEANDVSPANRLALATEELSSTDMRALYSHAADTHSIADFRAAVEDDESLRGWSRTVKDWPQLRRDIGIAAVPNMTPDDDVAELAVMAKLHAPQHLLEPLSEAVGEEGVGIALQAAQLEDSGYFGSRPPEVKRHATNLMNWMQRQPWLEEQI